MDTKHRSASLRQQSYLFQWWQVPYHCCEGNMITTVFMLCKYMMLLTVFAAGPKKYKDVLLSWTPVR